MKIPRLWLLIAGLLLGIIVFSMVLQAISSVLWQLSYWLPSWLVAPTLLLLVGALGLALYPLLLPWLKGRGQGPGPKLSPQAPGNRQEAARQNLAATYQQLSGIRDAVARQALEEQRRQVEESLQRGDLIVVVFGSGSSGKTSLIRALLNDQVGTVGAAMGSTSRSHSYRLRLQGLQRSIQLRDTPGILEAGEGGLEREQEARQEAVQGDL